MANVRMFDRIAALLPELRMEENAFLALRSETLQRILAPALRKLAITELRNRNVAHHYSAADLAHQEQEYVWAGEEEFTALAILFGVTAHVTFLPNGGREQPPPPYDISPRIAGQPVIHLYNWARAHWDITPHLHAYPTATLNDGNCLYNGFAQRLQEIVKHEHANRNAVIITLCREKQHTRENINAEQPHHAASARRKNFDHSMASACLLTVAIGLTVTACLAPWATLIFGVAAGIFYVTSGGFAISAYKQKKPDSDNAAHHLPDQTDHNKVNKSHFSWTRISRAMGLKPGHHAGHLPVKSFAQSREIAPPPSSSHDVSYAYRR